MIVRDTFSFGDSFFLNMKTQKKSFLFYHSWKNQIDILDDSELRKFINNLISYHDDGEVVLESKEDKLLWNGVLPALEVNKLKYDKTIERNRENGKKGGRPRKESTDQLIENHGETEGIIQKPKKPNGFIEKPKKPDNSKEINDNSKLEIGNSKKIKEYSEKNTVNGQNGNVETQEINEYQQQMFDNWRNTTLKKFKDSIQSRYPRYPELLSITTEEEIIETCKKIPNHIWNNVGKEITEMVKVFNSKLR